MLKSDILEVMTVEEWAGFLHYVDSKPKVFGTDSEGQPREEYATQDIHDYLFIKRGKEFNGKDRQSNDNPSSNGAATPTVPIRSEVAVEQPQPAGGC